MPRVFVLGSSNVDLVIRLPRLPRAGETVLGGDYATYPGGKGANQAVACARARAPGGDVAVAFLGALGDDAHGAATRANLAAEGLEVDGLTTLTGVPSGVAFLLVDQRGENQIAVAEGANAALAPEHVLPALERARPGDLLLASLEVPVATVTAAFAAARGRGLETWLNPAPMPAAGLPDALLAATRVVLPNRIETRALLRLADEAFPPPIDPVAGWTRRTGCALIATGGAAGVRAFGLAGESEPIGQPAFPVEVRDTVGAGDGFCGALAAHRAAGHAWHASLRFAAAAAALTVARDGAQSSLPHHADIAAFLRAQDA